MRSLEAKKLNNLKFHFPTRTSPVIARAGEYDTSGRRLPFPRVDINAGFVMHPNFNLRNLRNNIAVMFLERPAPFGMYPTITNLCIPST